MKDIIRILGEKQSMYLPIFSDVIKGSILTPIAKLSGNRRVSSGSCQTLPFVWPSIRRGALGISKSRLLL
jgi:hypothetical protein